MSLDLVPVPISLGDPMVQDLGTHLSGDRKTTQNKAFLVHHHAFLTGLDLSQRNGPSGHHLL